MRDCSLIHPCLSEDHLGAVNFGDDNRLVIAVLHVIAGVLLAGWVLWLGRKNKWRW